MKTSIHDIGRSCVSKWPAFLLGLFLLAPSNAIACRCAQLSLAEYYAQANIVMHARVAGVSVSDPAADVSAMITAQVLPDKTYKGRPIDKIRTPGSSAECGFELVAGQQLWVFASSAGRVDTCTGTRLINSDFADVPGGEVAARLASMVRAKNRPPVQPSTNESLLRDEILSKIDIKQVVREFGAEGIVSPAGAYRFILENPPAAEPPPMVALLRVDHEKDYQLVVTLQGIIPSVTARWINDAHIQVDATWAPDIASQIVVDVEQERVIQTTIIDPVPLP